MHQQQMGGGQVATADQIMQGVLGTFSFLLVLIAPLLAMRLLSEEAREGTLEVLMTLPMSDSTFVLGKFFAVWTFLTFLLGLTLVYVLLLLGISGSLNPGMTVGAYLGAWLYGGAALAVSMIWSAITEDQIVAAFLGAGSVLVLFLADMIAGIIARNQVIVGFAEFVRKMSVTAHYLEMLQNGLIRAEDIAYFILLIMACLFITTILVGTRRWRAS
jgi:ABC-2 type transport system permease protein